MLETANLESYKRGRVIIKEGVKDGRMFFLASGKVEVRKAGTPLCTLGRLGDVFGEIAALTGESRTATVIAKTDAKCLVTDAGLIEHLSKEGKLLFVHLLFQALSRIFSGRLSSTSDELVDAQEELENLRHENESLKALNAKLTEENNRLTDKTGSRLDWARRNPPQEKT